MSADPLISVIAPAFNATAFYDAWLGSIQAQGYPNIEIVLVDDGSTDRLPERAQKSPAFLRYIRQDNRGPAAARNLGIAASTGELIAFLDLDDLWAPGHLKRMSLALQAHPDAQIAQGLIRNFLLDDDGRPCYCSRSYRFINLGSAVFRRSVFDTCGLLEENMRFAEDFDFMIRCWEQGIRKQDIDELSLLYHRHANNMTHGKNVVEMGVVAIYKRRIDRLRAGKVKPASPGPIEVTYWDYIGASVWPFDEGIREPV
ncbi:MAG: glycosyltransferase family A protein [Bryobacteraceae bacterium]|jgi:glycosyltransferase involved in cell wall biosynthesis